MKKQVMLIASVIFVLTLAIAAFALNSSTANSCPMKNTQVAPAAEDVNMKNVVVFKSDEDCCEKGADCCKGGSCCRRKK